MTTAPDMFIGLHLEYIINGHTSARRRVEVTGHSISNGKLFTKLENMPDLDVNGVRLVVKRNRFYRNTETEIRPLEKAKTFFWAESASFGRKTLIRPK